MQVSCRIIWVSYIKSQKLMGSHQSSRKQEDAAGAAGAIAVLAAVAWGIASLVSGSISTSGGQRKTMKAPGRNQRIYRDDFQRDPASYFKGLRK